METPALLLRRLGYYIVSLSLSLFRELRVGFVSCSVVSFTNLTRRVGVVKEGQPLFNSQNI